MRYQDELRFVLRFAYVLCEAVNVDLVERGFYLVEHDERGRVDLEQGEIYRYGDERLLAAGEQRQALDYLSGRRDVYVYTGFENVVRLTQDELGGAAAEKPAEHLTEMQVDVLDRTKPVFISSSSCEIICKRSASELVRSAI